MENETRRELQKSRNKFKRRKKQTQGRISQRNREEKSEERQVLKD